MAQKQGWREAARKLAQERAQEEKEALGQALNYRWEHVQEVMRLALSLGRELGADLEVLEAAAWLHDIAKEPGEAYREGDNHGQAGAQEAVAFLARTDFPSEKLPAVAQAIERHIRLFKEYRVEPLEAAILWDADKLTKLGATAVALYLASSPQLTTLEAIIADGQRWLPLAERIAASMNTTPAQALAQKRLDNLHSFYRQLAEEIDLEEENP